MCEYSFKGCKLCLDNQTRSIPDAVFIKFAFKYISAYLSEEILPYNGFVYVPEEIEESTDIYITLVEDQDFVNLYLNKLKHIEISKKGFHNIQLCTEKRTDLHGYFFKVRHQLRAHYLDIINF